MEKVGRLLRERMTTHIKESLESRGNTVLISYSKVSGSQISELRKNLKKVDATLYISRNRIAQRALKDLKFDDLAERIDGQTAFVWSDADSANISKALVDFAKGCEGVIFHGGLLNGKILEKDDIKRLSDLPSKDVLLAMLFATIQSPLTRLAGALNGKTRELITLLKQISEQKGGK